MIAEPRHGYQDLLSRESAEEFSEELSKIFSGAVGLANWGADNDIPGLLGLTAEEWVDRKLKGPAKLSLNERRQVVRMQYAAGMSQRQIAAALGVGQATVHRDLADSNESQEQEVALDTVDFDDVSDSNESPDTIDYDPTTGEILPHVAQNSGENEWYTPAPYIQAARQVMGDIDLDPASHPIANRIIGAKEFYTESDNGLARHWSGRVWMNPPYAQPAIQHFMDKMGDCIESGDVTEAIVLSNNATETRWFQRLARMASAVCFHRGRIRYLDPTGKPANTPLQGQAFLYFGPNRDDFERVFGEFGVVL
jgi:hypothetical protein